MDKPVSTWEKWFRPRHDLAGEHPAGDGGQIVFAVLFFSIWIADSFFFRFTTQLNEIVSPWIRHIGGILILCVAGYCSFSGLRIVFGEIRETPSVIRKGVFNAVRHPVYLGEILLYQGACVISMSLVSYSIALVAATFLFYLARFEETMLLRRFEDDYRRYMREVGMFVPRVGRRRNVA
ncbi:MAG: isoprenylcysteine carboxylmethyltransferase family protein [Chitinispirillaceae bacterium]|nr:isoprenylcysteine carboxylmethyltransferase family protein [Chitinispirillaceae bacterium]